LKMRKKIKLKTMNWKNSHMHESKYSRNDVFLILMIFQ
ncbi:hypothetical protein T4B_683, partial [Trichinella pseudospiralis]